MSRLDLAELPPEEPECREDDMAEGEARQMLCWAALLAFLVLVRVKGGASHGPGA